MQEEIGKGLTRGMLAGKVAVVTGGGRGIGRATALRLAEAGASLAINYLSNIDAAEETAALCREKGSEALAFQADIARLPDAEKLIASAIGNFGKIDILIANAGIWEGSAIEDMPESLWDRVIEANLKSTWAICRAAAAQFRRQRSGNIVIVSSTAGQRGEAGYSNYAASKGGQIAFAKSLASELAPDIRVNCVAPGWVDTDLSADAFADEKEYARIIEGIPLKRVAQADDVALPILFLASDWSRHITGEVLNINGGSVLCG